MSSKGSYLDLTVTDEDFDRALGSATHSGRCMIAQAIKAKYGPKSRPTVDSDYIRLTNPATGDRLLYRTTPDAAAALISFDAGIRPRLPLRIHARIAFHKRHKRPAHEASIAEVREWARGAGLPGIESPGRLKADVIEAFRATHPGKTVAHQGQQTVSTSASHTVPKTYLPAASADATPRVGNLAGGHLPSSTARIPESRRRTWGSRTLTSVLLAQGWVAPDEAPADPEGGGDQ